MIMIMIMIMIKSGRSGFGSTLAKNFDPHL
jgi:hypothetical protein